MMDSGDGSTLQNRLALNPLKAGLDVNDRERVSKIIYDASKGSAFFKNEQRKDSLLEDKLVHLLRKAQSIADHLNVENETAKVDSILLKITENMPLHHTIVHVDMDSFYASVEELDRPDLKGKPFAVGGMAMLSTASYAARKFGVRSAMPGFIALKLCPELILVKPNFDKYHTASEKVREVFAEYDPNYSPMSLDEAYLDLTPYLESHPDHTPDSLVQELRAKVTARTNGLTCSAGIAPNRLLAKVCSDAHKPNGQMRLHPNNAAIASFMSSLPVRKVPGIGRVMERELSALGIVNCAELRAKLYLLKHLVTPTTWDFLARAAVGCGAVVVEEGERKSVGVERTMFPAISKVGEAKVKIVELAKHLAEDLEKEDVKGRTLHVKIKRLCSSDESQVSPSCAWRARL
ncbi:hypothetical protein BJ742DRAFT_273211 [Cladochytrium replicatum]|nr:hypothetical protein BJ742DRAFT_273211 [Cladochytrium replicatum]